VANLEKAETFDHRLPSLQKRKKNKKKRITPTTKSSADMKHRTVRNSTHVIANRRRIGSFHWSDHGF
jgi:hypothetical protein